MSTPESNTIHSWENGKKDVPFREESQTQLLQPRESNECQPTVCFFEIVAGNRAAERRKKPIVTVGCFLGVGVEFSEEWRGPALHGCRVGSRLGSFGFGTRFGVEVNGKGMQHGNLSHGALPGFVLLWRRWRCVDRNLHHHGCVRQRKWNRPQLHQQRGWQNEVNHAPSINHELGFLNRLEFGEG